MSNIAYHECIHTMNEHRKKPLAEVDDIVIGPNGKLYRVGYINNPYIRRRLMPLRKDTNPGEYVYFCIHICREFGGIEVGKEKRFYLGLQHVFRTTSTGKHYCVGMAEDKWMLCV